jgi:hypothetical protein
VNLFRRILRRILPSRPGSAGVASRRREEHALHFVANAVEGGNSLGQGLDALRRSDLSAAAAATAADAAADATLAEPTSKLLSDVVARIGRASYLIEQATVELIEAQLYHRQRTAFTPVRGAMRSDLFPTALD